MSNRAPRYRSFRKAYGGDPDTSILRDLHKRLTRTEQDLALAETRIAELLEHAVRCEARWNLLLVKDPILGDAPQD